MCDGDFEQGFEIAEAKASVRLQAVRELHKPVDVRYRPTIARESAFATPSPPPVLQCGECQAAESSDYYYSAVPVDWPCPTAKLVYTEAEITKALDGG
jgi:hypothetical protein